MTRDADERSALENLLHGKLTRRSLVGIALSATASGLLVACAEDDDGEEDVDAAEAEVPTPEVEATTDDDPADDPTDDADDEVDQPDDMEAREIPQLDNPDPGPPVGDKPEEVIIAVGVNPFDSASGIDPQLHGGTTTEMALRHMYEPLVAFDTDLQTFLPILATDWELVDELTMQFHLREGITFHNGEEFNAESAHFSILRPLSDETPGSSRSDFDVIDEVEVVDEFTINVKTHQPDPVLLNRFAGFHMTMVPMEWASQGPDVVASEAFGTGPYKFVSWSPEEDLVMEVNEDYWGDIPEIERVRITHITEDSTRVAALRAGDIHFATAVPPEQIPAIDGDEGVRSSRALASRVVWYNITREVEPFDDVRVRQAINYAVDMETLVDAILEGNGYPVPTVLATWSLGYTEEFEYQYDPDRARELLEEAGYPDGIDMSFWYVSGRVPKDGELAEAICQQLNEANIRCTPELLAWEAFQDARRGNVIEGLSFQSLGNRMHDPDGLLTRTWSCVAAEESGDWRHPYGCNPELDEVLDEARVELDPERRDELYVEAQRIIYEDAGALWGYQVVDVYGLNNWLLWEPRHDEMVWAHQMRWNE